MVYGVGSDRIVRVIATGSLWRDSISRSTLLGLVPYQFADSSVDWAVPMQWAIAS